MEGWAKAEPLGPQQEVPQQVEFAQREGQAEGFVRWEAESPQWEGEEAESPQGKGGILNWHGRRGRELSLQSRVRCRGLSVHSRSWLYISAVDNNLNDVVGIILGERQ